MLSVKSAINKSFNKKRPANILTVYYDGVFDCTLAETGHNFFGAANQSCYQWTHLAGCKPPNIHICDKEELYAKDFDFILVNDRIRNGESVRKYMDYFSLPAIVIDHDLSNENKYVSKHMVPANCETIADTPAVKSSFLSNLLIEPYFDSVDMEKDIDFIIVGDFLETDRKTIDGIVRTSSNSVFVGNLDIKGKVEPKSYEEYLSLIYRSKVFVLLNTKPGLCYNAMRALFSGSMLCSTQNAVLKSYLEQKWLEGWEFKYTIDNVEQITQSISKALEVYEKPNVKMWDRSRLNLRYIDYKMIFDNKLNEVLIV